MNVEYSHYTSGDGYTLLYKEYATKIASTDEVAIARGITSIIVSHWTDKKERITRMMRLFIPHVLRDMGLTYPNPHIEKVIMEVAQAYQDKVMEEENQ